MKKIFLIMTSLFLITTANASLEEIFGNADNGDSCVSDYQCESLCCNKSVGNCVNETCQGAVQPPVPPFDPNDCSQAIDP
jgi:hypothetical protein